MEVVGGCAAWSVELFSGSPALKVRAVEEKAMKQVYIQAYTHYWREKRKRESVCVCVCVFASAYVGVIFFHVFSSTL